MKHVQWAAVVALMVALGGCAGGTKISDSWKDTSMEPAPMEKIVVVALTDDSVTKHMFEDRFAAALRARGNDAVASYTFVKAGSATNPDSLVAVLRAQGYTAALTARSLGEDMQETQTLGHAYYMPQGYYEWGSYYSMSYGAMMSTSYNERSGSVVVESNLFDLGYTSAVVRELARSRWIK